MKTVIVPAKPEDAAALLSYLRQVGAETDNLTFGAEGLPLSVEEYLARLEHSRDTLFLLAKDNSRIVGTATLNRLPRRMSHRAEICLSVLKAYWHQGIGRRLLGELIAFAGQNGMERLDLQVRCDNIRAIRLYESFGFQRLCTYPGFFKIGEESIDFDWMSLRLP